MNRYGWLGLMAAVSAAVTVTAMPSRNDLKKVSPTVNELMLGDMKAVKAGELKQKDAADHAVNYAREATDEASKFLFYKGAFGLYVKGRAYSDALRTLELLKAEVKDVPDKVLLEIIGGKLKDVPKEDGGALVALYESLDRKLRCQNDVVRLEAALKSNPKDADSRKLLAVRRAQLGDWSAALKDFALLEGAESKAAKNEQIVELKAAADGWWEVAANADEDEQTLFRRHAADLYRRAIAKGKVTGIQKSLAQKRADEYPELRGDDAPVVAKGDRSPQRYAEGGVATTTPAAKADAAPKAVVKPGKGITLKLKKGVPLEFVHCPAGTYTKGLCCIMDGGPLFGPTKDSPHKVKISRPFYMTRTPITCNQFYLDAIGKLPAAKDPREEALQKIPEYGLSAMAIKTEEIASGVFYSWIADLSKRFASELPRGYVIRLPTESEYEYAVRAGSDDVNDLFVNPSLSPQERALLTMTKEERQAMSQKNQLTRSFNPPLAYPVPVASRKANAWGIHDGWSLEKVIVADRWMPGKIAPYRILPAPLPDIKDGVVDPILTVPEGEKSGNIVYSAGRSTIGRSRGMRDVTFACIGDNNGTGKRITPGLFFGAGFFLVIAPDVSTLTAITPPKE